MKSARAEVRGLHVYVHAKAKHSATSFYMRNEMSVTVNTNMEVGFRRLKFQNNKQDAKLL